jgi:ATPase subunit of ABC transporter with duplicated ATPase domains
MIALSNITKQYGRQILFVDTSVQLRTGEKIGLVGPNGSGKTTLFRMISGEEQPDEGGVAIPKRTTIAYFRQDVETMGGNSTLDEAIVGSGRVGELHHQLAGLERDMGDPGKTDQMDEILARFGTVQEEYQQSGGYELEARAREVLHGLGFEEEMIDGDVAHLSGGWKMRVAMAKVLLADPDVLLMDEPTNHLDIESILWLEKYLKNSTATLVMTCHDRDFMNRIVDRIVDIDGGALIEYSGDYESFVTERSLRANQREATYQRQQAMLAKEQRFIERFSTHAAKAAQVQSRVKKLEKIEKIELPRRRKPVKFEFRAPPRSGEDVAVLSGIDKRFGSKTIYKGFDLTIRRGERWCVMGRNGAGKTTLLKIVAGALTPDNGSVRIGPSVTLGYFAQQALDVLDPRATILDQLQRDFPLETQATLRKLLGAFQFPGDDVDKKIAALSGGEKTRLVISRMLLNPPNFLVLDEPTNHLDLETKEMLIEALAGFPGSMLFVSHDREFLRGLSNRVLDLQPEDATHGPDRYRGGYAEWVEATGQDAPGVHR